MNIHDRLFVEIHPMESGQIPHPHPVAEARFDPAFVYKVLGMYNASETSECYFVLVNPQRQIWFIPQRHLLAYGLIDSDEFFLTLDAAEQLRQSGASNRQDGSVAEARGTNGVASPDGSAKHLVVSRPLVSAGSNGSASHDSLSPAKNGHADPSSMPGVDRQSSF